MNSNLCKRANELVERRGGVRTRGGGVREGSPATAIKTKKYKTFKCFSRFLESKKYTTATFSGFFFMTFPDFFRIFSGCFLRLFPEFFYKKMGWNTESRVRRRKPGIQE